MKLKRGIFKRVDEDFEFQLPQSPIYYFTGRRSYRIVPKWTTWNVEHHNKPEEIFELDVTVVGMEWNVSVEKFKISANERVFQEFIDSNPSRSLSTAQEIIHKLLYFPDGDARTKEQFEQDFKTALEKLQSLNGY